MIDGATVIRAVIQLICLGLVFWLLWWLVSYLNPPEPFRKVLNAILAIAAVIVLISVIMAMAGMPLVRWG